MKFKMSKKYIFFYIKNSSKEFQRKVVFLLERYYSPKKISKKIDLLKGSYKKDIKYFLKKLKKETNKTRGKTILKEIETLIKSNDNIQYLNTFIIKDESKKLSLSKYISIKIDEIEKRIKYIQQYMTSELKKEGKKNYMMITFYPKFKTDIETGVNIICDVRKIMTSIVREDIKYKNKKFGNKKFRHMAIPEISKNDTLHLHVFVYEEFSEEEAEKLKMKLERGIERSDIFIKDFDIDVKLFDLEGDNYSSSYNNILNKMGDNIRSNKVLYFVLIKMFGRRRFLTHSLLEVSFNKVKDVMKLFWKHNVFNFFKLSYAKLAEIIITAKDSIQFKISNGYISLYDFIVNKLKFSFVSEIKIFKKIFVL